MLQIGFFKKLAQPIGRTGNPDMHFLGTLKNKFQFLRFQTINMKDIMLLFYQGSYLDFISVNYHKYGNPEIKNIIFS